jgi:hypothetical protein
MKDNIFCNETPCNKVKFIDVSKERTTSIIRIEVKAKQKVCLFSRTTYSSALRCRQYISLKRHKLLPDYTASDLRKYYGILIVIAVRI